MNIGIVTTWFERGAGYVSKQYKNVLEKEHSVFIYARGGEKYAIGNNDWDGEKITWGKKIPIHMPMSIDLVDFKKWISKNQLDVVLFNEQQWWDPVILCNELGIKCGAYVDYYTKETVPFFGLYDFLVCNTKRHYGVFSWHPQAVYVPWGTDINLFKPVSLGPVEKGAVTFFHSCGVSPERKGTDLLLRAFVNTLGPAKLIIHSQTDLKIFYPQLKDLIINLEKSGRLFIETKTVPAPGLYHLGDVYVYPTRLEGIGLTMAEALACGLPLIVPDNGPMSEFINHDCGKLVRVDRCFERADGYFWPQCEVNTGSLTTAMQYYVDNKENISEFKNKARKHAEEERNWFKNANGLVEQIVNFKSLGGKKMVTVQVENFEAKRSNWQTKLYRRLPFLFRPFGWLWPIIKQFYIFK